MSSKRKQKETVEEDFEAFVRHQLSIFNQLMFYFTNNNMISSKQYGF